jgi:hypothetical protein
MNTLFILILGLVLIWAVFGTLAWGVCLSAGKPRPRRWEVVESGELMVDSEINLQGGAVVAQLAHNQEVGGAIPSPATKMFERVAERKYVGSSNPATHSGCQHRHSFFTRWGQVSSGRLNGAGSNPASLTSLIAVNPRFFVL